MGPAHLHLPLNHLPVVGTIGAIPLRRARRSGRGEDGELAHRFAGERGASRALPVPERPTDGEA